MEDWIKAGRITSEVREFSKSLVKPGARLLDIAEQIEDRIKTLGAVPAFPVNLSLNEIAAHYTPIANDPTVLEDEVVKVDIGVSYNGAIGDTAYTMDLSGRYSDLVKASDEALKSAIKAATLGARIGDIGKVIQETIQSHGFAPIRNLSGHGLGLYSVHQPPTIPNFAAADSTILTKGQIIAIEPFATTGLGLIKESSNPMIYSQVGDRQVRSPFARDVLKSIQAYRRLPFATRWLSHHGEGRLKLALRELMQAQVLREYPPLPEAAKGMVSQAEHSLIIDEKVIVTTR
jgi:methionyl aminopeptidase